jgi:SAM-dependent methyltransferase
VTPISLVPDPDPASASPSPAPDELRTWARAYLRQAPLSLCLRELNRLIAIKSAEAGGPALSPVLDVGCGDGFWWTLRKADGRDVYGIDISEREVGQAVARIRAAVSDVSREVPFAPLRFQQIIGNCSLEHVPDIDGALKNLRAAAAPGARLVMFVPTPSWAYQGLMQGALLRHAPRVAMMISGMFNGFFQHWHLYDEAVWRHLLERTGWSVRSVQGLGSKRSEFMFRLFLIPALGQFLVKSLTGRYPARLYRYLPKAALTPLVKLMEWALTDPLVPSDSSSAYEYMIIADAAEPAR